VGSVLWALCMADYRRDKFVSYSYSTALSGHRSRSNRQYCVALLGPPIESEAVFEAEEYRPGISAGVLWWIALLFLKNQLWRQNIFTPVVAEEPASADIATRLNRAPLFRGGNPK